jgi:hypothetical protein
MNCPVCHHALPANELAFCAACGAPLAKGDRRPNEARLNALETWSGWDGLVVSQEAAMSYWYVARRDHAHLTKLVQSWRSSDDPVRRLLAAKLDRGLVCDPDQLPRDVVTIGTRLEFRFRGELERCVLVDPAQQSHLRDAISVASPLGALLLGVLEGRSLRSRDADGTAFALRVERVHQPESLRAPAANEAAQ